MLQVCFSSLVPSCQQMIMSFDFAGKKKQRVYCIYRKKKHRTLSNIEIVVSVARTDWTLKQIVPMSITFFSHKIKFKVFFFHPMLPHFKWTRTMHRTFPTKYELKNSTLNFHQIHVYFHILFDFVCVFWLRKSWNHPAENAINLNSHRENKNINIIFPHII